MASSKSLMVTHISRESGTLSHILTTYKSLVESMDLSFNCPSVPVSCISASRCRLHDGELDMDQKPACKSPQLPVDENQSSAHAFKAFSPSIRALRLSRFGYKIQSPSARSGLLM